MALIPVRSAALNTDFLLGIRGVRGAAESEAMEPCTSDAARNASSAASGGNVTVTDDI